VVWAFTYGLVGAAPPGTPLVYFAFGNYATLGYGDLIPRRPMAAPGAPPSSWLQAIGVDYVVADAFEHCVVPPVGEAACP
jgi:hypothetical protein